MGVIVNYGPEDAIQFDLKREPGPNLGSSLSPGTVHPPIGGLAISKGELAALFWGCVVSHEFWCLNSSMRVAEFAL